MTTLKSDGSTMKALVGGMGPDWVLDEVPVPVPAKDQVLVRVWAAGVNRADLLMLEGAYNPEATWHTTTFVAGLELPGEVAVVGEDVSGVKVGDRVMAATRFAFAPFAPVDYRHLIPVPESTSWTDAAALPVGLTTEHDALTQAGFTTGQRVLITAATSGVGLLGVQVAKALGASLVMGTTNSAAHVDAARAVGTDLVVDTSRDDLTAAVLAATDGAGVDVVLDHVGGAAFCELLAATHPRGTIINIGRLAGRTATVDLDLLAFRRLRVLGTTFSIRSDEERGEVAAAVKAEVVPAVAAGRIRPVVDRVIPFADALKAAELMRASAVTGKIVLDLAGVE
jgi:NADPH:quinone reductase-like Zn-dependent oxidoreductase